MTAPVASEKQFQKAVMDTAKTCGWKVFHVAYPVRAIGKGKFVPDTQAAGFPDCVFVRGNRLIFAELKKERGKTSESQREWLDALRWVNVSSPNVECHLWRPSSWPQIEEALR